MKQIECADVSQSYGRKNALFHVDCVIEAGKVCALCGGNGAGKTTLMKLFAGCLPFTVWRINAILLLAMAFLKICS